MNPSSVQPASLERYIEANGINIHYAEYGSGYPLLLLHGGTANLDSWEAQIPAFAEHFRVIAPDTRGHGKTENPSETLSYRVLADDVAAFIQALNLQKPLVFGYSDGGQIALELGVHYPELSGALVLGGTVYQFTPDYFDVLKGMGLAQAGVVDFEAMEHSDPGWIAYLKSAHPRADNAGYWRELMTQISTLWWTPPMYTADDLQKIAASTLILVGDRDDSIPFGQTLEMYQHIPAAELAVIPNADHGSTINELSMPIALDFLQRKVHGSPR